MGDQSLLDQLPANHLPEPIGLWPLAPGWWLTALVSLIIISTTIYCLIKWRNKTRYRRLGKVRAKAVFMDYQQHKNQRKFAHECNRLLKQVALHAYPDSDVAGLHGHKWQSFLSDTGKNPEFLSTAGHALGDGRFDPELTLDVAALQTLTLNWIRKHHA